MAVKRSLEFNGRTYHVDDPWDEPDGILPLRARIRYQAMVIRDLLAELQRLRDASARPVDAVGGDSDA